ncbi:hypothetical protein [Paenibacillus harenae]|uniref:hypothetical protein n=1 Tax=Paenibacillus harenae TaxID=306543 RepID=UPI00278F9297|nr:hypothetical protein [Paenibacillus harenae]MDQ0061703.1 hypothetical protein [Paenibacillus harenae]
MKNNKLIYTILTLLVLLLTSACGTQSSAETPADTEATTKPADSSPANTDAPTDDSASAEKEILIIIDQTPKPIEGNSFDFVVKQLPEGYALAEMQWVSEANMIIDSIDDAIAHGGNGDAGFYISGDGQFMGFFYPDSMKGEKGKAVFLFKNEAGKELTWTKEITLK